jgi:hypothetical protein
MKLYIEWTLSNEVKIEQYKCYKPHHLCIGIKKLDTTVTMVHIQYQYVLDQ